MGLLFPAHISVALPQKPRSASAGKELAEAAQDKDNHDKVMDILTHQHPELNRKTGNCGLTPLMNAARYGWTDVAEKLLQYKVCECAQRENREREKAKEEQQRAGSVGFAVAL